MDYPVRSLLTSCKQLLMVMLFLKCPILCHWKVHLCGMTLSYGRVHDCFLELPVLSSEIMVETLRFDQAIVQAGQEFFQLRQKLNYETHLGPPFGEGAILAPRSLFWRSLLCRMLLSSIPFPDNLRQLPTPNCAADYQSACAHNCNQEFRTHFAAVVQVDDRPPDPKS
jgi:hypothetical protein